ncbi:MAG: sugar transporter permease [Microbacteriaceae bacterium]|nr:sugar transporter permease [Microbacteriaceae bacterium]
MPSTRRIIARRPTREFLPGILFVLPAVILFIAFVGYPLVSSLYYSLFSWAGYGVPEFIGFDNFVNLTQDPNFQSAVVVTVVYTVATTILQTIVPMLVAILFMQKWRAGALLRTMIFIPSVISLTITGLLWQLVLQPDGGLLEVLLNRVGLGGLSRPWLADSTSVVPVLIIVSLWQSLGFFLVIYYAGLQGIDPELYEAARVDGASGFRLMRYITIPSLRSVTTLVISLNLINGLKVFDLIYAMTAGGPGTASQSLGVYLYKLAFGSENGASAAFGYADAIGVVMMIAAAILFLVVSALRRGRRA